MIRVVSLFSGIGAFEKALTRQGIAYELVNYCEIDKYASKSYSLIHNELYSKNLRDVTTIEAWDIDGPIDLITYGFPCQDISVAGKQKGFKDEEGNTTRSGLFFEALRIIQDYKPKFAICENVKALTGKKFKAEFETVLTSLSEAGYSNYWQVLNAKDYGIPQNRERVFIVSIRKDIDKGYAFPAKVPLELRLKDLLEKNVEEKYYLSDKSIKTYNRDFGSKGQKLDPEGISNTLTASMGGGGANVPIVQQVGNLREATSWSNPQCGRVYSSEGISPTLNTMGDGQREPKIIEPSIDVIFNIPKEQLNDNERQRRVYGTEGLAPSVLSRSDTPKVLEPFVVASRGRNPENPSDRTTGAPTEQRLEPKLDGCSNTITTVQKDNYVAEPISLRIRKLTPKEVWRLMGFDDIDIDKCIDGGLSNTQLYKQAGNSIVVQVLEAIFREIDKIYKFEKEENNDKRNNIVDDSDLDFILS